MNALFEKKCFTIGDFVSAVLSIQEKLEAESFYQDYLSWLKENKSNNSEKIARQNIGWCFGEGMSEDKRQMWISACGACHPIYGQSTPYTFQEAFEAGIKMGESLK